MLHAGLKFDAPEAQILETDIWCNETLNKLNVCGEDIPKVSTFIKFESVQVSLRLDREPC